MLDRFLPNYITFRILIGRENYAKKTTGGLALFLICHPRIGVASDIVRQPKILRLTTPSWTLRGGSSRSYHNLSLALLSADWYSQNVNGKCKCFYTVRGLKQSYLHLHSHCFILLSCCSVQGGIFPRLTK